MPRKPYELAPDFRAALRVKVKSLMEEAKIIRREEDRAHGWHNWINLKNHRRGIVRTEARAAQLAYGFLRGMPYEVMEPLVHPGHEPEWKRVAALIEKYSVAPGTPFGERKDIQKDALKRFEEWAPNCYEVQYAVKSRKAA